MPSLSFCLEKTLLHDALSGYAGMIESWRKEGFLAQHTVPADVYERNDVWMADGLAIALIHLGWQR